MNAVFGWRALFRDFRPLSDLLCSFTPRPVSSLGWGRERTARKKQNDLKRRIENCIILLAVLAHCVVSIAGEGRAFRELLLLFTKMKRFCRTVWQLRKLLRMQLWVGVER
jgi:hypothetical protein